MTDTNPNPMTVMLTLDEYADRAGVSSRTIKRWLADDELPCASLAGGRWSIPADARRVQRLATRSAEVTTVTEEGHVPIGATLTEALDHLTAYVPIGQAAQLLGITEHAIRIHRAHFGLVPYGPHGALVMPQSVIRGIAGRS